MGFSFAGMWRGSRKRGPELSGGPLQQAQPMRADVTARSVVRMKSVIFGFEADLQ